MDTPRRAFVTSVPVILLSGCINTSDSGGLVELANRDTEPHDLQVRILGTENEEPVVDVTEHLEVDEERELEDPLDFSTIEGDLRVVTRIGDEEEREHDVAGGFASLSVWIDESSSIELTRGDF